MTQLPKWKMTQWFMSREWTGRFFLMEDKLRVLLRAKAACR